MSGSQGVGRLCQATGLRLLAARGETAHRVSEDRGRGPLSGYPNTHVGEVPAGEKDPRGRWDTIGSTVYFSDTQETAFAEVLRGFRKDLMKLAPLAEIAGYSDVGSYAQAIIDDAADNAIDRPWAISCEWQMSRSIYHVAMPKRGWWVQIDDPHTLVALGTQVRDLGLGTRLPDLTSSHLEGDDRALTTTIAEHIRGLTLDDGSRPLGIDFRSKSLVGRCWAWWDRRGDDGLGPSRNDPQLLRSDNVDVTAFRNVAGHYQLPILPGRPL